MEQQLSDANILQSLLQQEQSALRARGGQQQQPLSALMAAVQQGLRNNFHTLLHMARIILHIDGVVKRPAGAEALWNYLSQHNSPDVAAHWRNKFARSAACWRTAVDCDWWAADEERSSVSAVVLNLLHSQDAAIGQLVRNNTARKHVVWDAVRTAKTDAGVHTAVAASAFLQKLLSPTDAWWSKQKLGLPSVHPALRAAPSHLEPLCRQAAGSDAPVEVRIHEQLSRARGEAGQPLEFGLYATAAIKEGALVTSYGGVLRSLADFRRAQNSPSADDDAFNQLWANTHIRRVADSDYLLDGFPLACMYSRPVTRTPSQLQQALLAGMAPLRPSLVNFSPEQLELFGSSAFGFMANTADGRGCNVRIGYDRIPMGGRGDVRLTMSTLIASRDIAVDEEILCPYNSNDAKLLLSTSAEEEKEEEEKQESPPAPLRMSRASKSAAASAAAAAPHTVDPMELDEEAAQPSPPRQSSIAAAAAAAGKPPLRARKPPSGAPVAVPVAAPRRAKEFAQSVPPPRSVQGRAARGKSDAHLDQLRAQMRREAQQAAAAHVAAGAAARQQRFEATNDINRLRSGQLRAGSKRSAADLDRSGEAEQPSLIVKPRLTANPICNEKTVRWMNNDLACMLDGQEQPERTRSQKESIVSGIQYKQYCKKLSAVALQLSQTFVLPEVDLVLHYGGDKPGQLTLKSNAGVKLLQPVDDAHTAFARDGCARMQNLLPPALLGQLLDGMAMLQFLLPKVTPKNPKQGVTISVDHEELGLKDGKNDKDSKSRLQELKQPLQDMLRTLRQNPRLLSWVRQVLPGAEPDTHCYMRIKNENSYTLLHSDFGFFHSLNKQPVDEEHDCSQPFSNVFCDNAACQQKGLYDVCTVWLPLTDCCPASGALLLFPETLKLSAPHKQDSLLPDSFDRTLFKQGKMQCFSAEMDAGDGLIFGPTIVHGAASRPTSIDAEIAPRLSIDLRFRVPSTKRLDVPALTSAIVIELGTEILSVKQQPFHRWHNSDLLNNIYLFTLFLRVEAIKGMLQPAAVEQLEQLRKQAQAPRLLTAYSQIQAAGRSVEKESESILSPLQRFQYCKTFPDSHQDASSISDSAAAFLQQHRSRESADLIQLRSFICTIEQLTAITSLDAWSDVYVQSWIHALHAWTTTVSFISIHADQGQAQLVCEFIPLWKALYAGPNYMLQRWCEQEQDAFTSLVCAVLYLASHTIFAQTLYHTQALDKDIIGLEEVARLFRSVLPYLEQWNHGELVTEAISVLALANCPATEMNRLWRWVNDRHCMLPRIAKWKPTKPPSSAAKKQDSLHLINTVMLAAIATTATKTH